MPLTHLSTGELTGEFAPSACKALRPAEPDEYAVEVAVPLRPRP